MTDMLIQPVAQQLLDCLCAALPLHMAVDKVPARCCFRPGENISGDASLYEDLCCEGQAWVRVTNISPTSDSFPAPETFAVITGCGPFGWELSMEMGVMRCAPTGDISMIPTCAEWNELQVDIMNDARAMRAAMCCLIDQLDPGSVAIGAWSPLPTTGGCAGGTWDVTVQIINCGEDC